MRKRYHSGKKWYREEQVQEIYDLYLEFLSQLELGPGHIFVECAQCQISFITSSSNRGRTDIRCPFGCRKLHRSRQSNKRSRDYYRTPEGKEKKKQLNGQRTSKNPTPPKKRQENSDSFYSLYLRLLLFLIFENPPNDEQRDDLLKRAQAELRQHSLEKITGSIKLGKYG